MSTPEVKVRFPVCPDCGTKFPGTPCRECTKKAEVKAAKKAEKAKRGKQPKRATVTRRRKKHGKP